MFATLNNPSSWQRYSYSYTLSVLVSITPPQLTQNQRWGAVAVHVLGLGVRREDDVKEPEARRAPESDQQHERKQEPRAGHLQLSGPAASLRAECESEL